MVDVFFGSGAIWYTTPAVLGTAVFLLRMILMGAGAATDADFDDGGDLDFDAEFDTDAMAHSGHAFAILSINTVAAFLMGFGWGGLAAMKGSPWGDSWLLVVATAMACGVGMTWVMVLLLKLLYDMQASGNISIRRAIGAEGTVYIEVPAKGEGRGRVRLVLEGHERTYNAVTEGAAITRRERVKVTKVNRDNTVTVVAV
jgi:hypothetical protein